MTDSSLQVQSRGRGVDLVLLHGWAMHEGYFDTVAEKLAEDFRVHQVDLPGHGKSRDYPVPYSIDNLAKQVQQVMTPLINSKAIWLGWSLGGCIATWIASQAPDIARALILVASNPCFVKRDDWPDGIAAAVLQEFATNLITDYDKTLLRFLSLQIRGADHERQLLRDLRQQQQRYKAPTEDVLTGGLNILQDFDARDVLRELPLPVFMLAGEKDTLVPVKALHVMAEQAGHITLSVWQGTGHAPFLANVERFSNELKAFADGVTQ